MLSTITGLSHMDFPWRKTPHDATRMAMLQAPYLSRHYLTKIEDSSANINCIVAVAAVQHNTCNLLSPRERRKGAAGWRGWKDNVSHFLMKKLRPLPPLSLSLISL